MKRKFLTLEGDGFMKRLLLMGFILLFSLNMVAGTTSAYAKPQVQLLANLR
jgi:hypothetical protein